MYAGYWLASCAVVTFGWSTVVGHVTVLERLAAVSAYSIPPPSRRASTVTPVCPGTLLRPLALGCTRRVCGGRFTAARTRAVSSRTA